MKIDEDVLAILNESNSYDSHDSYDSYSAQIDKLNEQIEQGIELAYNEVGDQIKHTYAKDGNLILCIWDDYIDDYDSEWDEQLAIEKSEFDKMNMDDIPEYVKSFILKECERVDNLHNDTDSSDSFDDVDPVFKSNPYLRNMFGY